MDNMTLFELQQTHKKPLFLLCVRVCVFLNTWATGAEAGKTNSKLKTTTTTTIMMMIPRDQRRARALFYHFKFWSHFTILMRTEYLYVTYILKTQFVKKRTGGREVKNSHIRQ